MNITQSYAKPSSASVDASGLKMSVSAELSRPGVRLDAQIKESLAYARVMLALHKVVSSDLRAQQKDHSAYQAWVQERYLEELSETQGRKLATLPGLNTKRDELKAKVASIDAKIRPLEGKLSGKEFLDERAKYFKWLWDHDRDGWMLLDPVVSVHPDCVVFEVFSLDESSYGRVTVPFEHLDTFGETQFGTTNVDFSFALADEIKRVRSYRPAFLSVGAEGVSVSTGAGERFEKKIDLPPTWVRGFLQVQSAASFPATEVTLSATTIAEVLLVLEREREKHGPRSLKFILKTGEKPIIRIEPWNIDICEATHVYEGPTQDIRLWGRRRLLTFKDLLPYADKVTVQMLGSGMPSYWTIFQKGHRFDLGLSGWTKNDWSSAARFDLLAASVAVSDGDIAVAKEQLANKLRLSPADLSKTSDLTPESATTALQSLCKQGLAMYDLAEKCYRWRQLLPFPAPMDNDGDQRTRLAGRLIATGGVRFLKPGEEDEEAGEGFGSIKNAAETVTRFRATVRGGETKRERKFAVVVDLDSDGRASFVNCNCSWHRREKLKQGPCAHILAAVVLAGQQLTEVKQAKVESSAGSTSTNPLARPDFTGKIFVFTGALTLFTREQAEALVEQYGGKASGSVSKNTTYLVAGDKAGSKLTKANDLGVPVITEQDFQKMIGG
jgi:BRCA1 C Terminus (BRCT) domain